MLSASQIIDLNQSNKLLSAFTDLASDCDILSFSQINYNYTLLLKSLGSVNVF